RRGLEDLAGRQGLSLEDLNIFLVLPSNEAVREAVEAGVGATIISRHVAATGIRAGASSRAPCNADSESARDASGRRRRGGSCEGGRGDFLTTPIPMHYFRIVLLGT